jgi:hypothetical protein
MKAAPTLRVLPRPRRPGETRPSIGPGLSDPQRCFEGGLELPGAGWLNTDDEPGFAFSAADFFGFFASRFDRI